MGDMTMWRFCPFCGGQWEPGGGVLKDRLASGRIVCGRCGVEWSDKAKADRAALAAALRKAYEGGVRELARKAAEGGEAAADELMTEFISKKRAANWGIINEGLLACGALIRALSSPSLPADVAELLAAVEGRKEEKDE